MEAAKRKSSPLPWRMSIVAALALACLLGPHHSARAYLRLGEVVHGLEAIRDRRAARIEDLVARAIDTVVKEAASERAALALAEFKNAMVKEGPDGQGYARADDIHGAYYAALAESMGYYDVFLVDASGRVAYTARRESDFGGDLSQGPLAETPLARCFSRAMEKGGGFSSYDLYEPSREAASFAGAAIRDKDGRVTGALIIQMPLDPLNRVLAPGDGLGRTGESYLVDDRYRMLTRSRFLGDAPLRVRVETEAARLAISGRGGFDICRDYRGVLVFSAFAPVEVDGVKWAVMVEMDQDEVVMNMSGPERRELIGNMMAELEAHSDFNRLADGPSGESRFVDFEGRGVKLVDTGEVAMAGPAKTLVAPGVATCTALVVAMPGGHAVMAHVPPVDRSYRLGPVAERLWLRGRGTDLVGEVLALLERSDMSGSIGDARAYIFANQTRSPSDIIGRLIDAGVRPSNIRLVLGPGPGSWTVVSEGRSSGPGGGNEYVKVTARFERLPAGQESLATYESIEGAGTFEEQMGRHVSRWFSG